MQAATTYSYPCSLVIDYSTSQEYRHWIRVISQMNSAHYPAFVKAENGGDVLDDETRDENEYDDESMNECMEWIFVHTKDVPWFQDIYVLAAGRMFSTNPEIGLAILLSYDYLFFFHPILAIFFDKTADEILIGEMEERMRDLKLRIFKK